MRKAWRFSRRDRRVDAVEQPVEAGPLVALHVGLAEADVDDLDAAYGPGGVLDDGAALPLKISAPCSGASLRSVSALADQLAPTGQQVAGVQLPVCRDGVAVTQLEPPCRGRRRCNRSFHRSASTPRAERT